jgi:hypothetical protein
MFGWFEKHAVVADAPSRRWRIGDEVSKTMAIVIEKRPDANGLQYAIADVGKIIWVGTSDELRQLARRAGSIA